MPGALSMHSQSLEPGRSGGNTRPTGTGPGAQGLPTPADTIQGLGRPVAPWGPGVAWGPLPIPISFNGNPNRLAMVLSHLISHLDRYAHLYPSQWAMVVVVTAGLQGEATAWATDLYSDHARELADAGLFLEALHSRFEDASRLQQAEAEVLSLKQRGRPAADYVQDFRQLASRLCSSWPECLLVHHFQAGLDRELHQACVFRGVPNRLREWFRVAVDLDTGLREFRKGGEDTGRP